MKVFISWSGELSKQLGQALRQWLPGTLQSVKPYFTPADIDKGAKWESEISKELEASGFCIIAMTKEALNSHWIVFEAGAVSKEAKKSRVCAICFNLKSTDMKGPLTTFQAIQWNKDEFRQLVDGINKASGDAALAETVLAEVFEERWPKLASQIEKILNSGVSSKKSEVRGDRELLEEVLLLVRGMQKDQLNLSTRFHAAFPSTTRQRVVNALASDTGTLDAPADMVGDTGTVGGNYRAAALETLMRGWRETNLPEVPQGSKLPPKDGPSKK
jgi:hypothetical protein